MFKKLFKRETNDNQTNDQQNTPNPTVPVFSGKPSKKLKNTYVVRLKDTFTMPGAFELCPSTPLAVVEINGQPTDNARGGWMSCTQFPNPGACQMEIKFHHLPEFRIIVGDKAAQTIVEYLDKETKQPALILYPDGCTKSLVPNLNETTVVMTRLNHASRRDLNQRRARIHQLAQVINPLIAERNHAMKHAPQYGSNAYAQFIADLNQRQTERAQQIAATLVNTK